MLKCTLFWVHPVEYGEPTQHHTHKTDSSSPSSYQLPVDSHFLTYLQAGILSGLFFEDTVLLASNLQSCCLYPEFQDHTCETPCQISSRVFFGWLLFCINLKSPIFLYLVHLYAVVGQNSLLLARTEICSHLLASC